MLNPPKRITLGNANLNLQTYPRALFRSIYGVGHTRANKMDSIFLHHPAEREFQSDLVGLSQDPGYKQMFTNSRVSHPLRLGIFRFLMDKVDCECYRAYRMFQNLPAHGQRTHANGNTPARPYNPFQQLGLEPSFVTKTYAHFKHMELKLNNRDDDLKLLQKNQSAAKKAAGRAKKNLPPHLWAKAKAKGKSKAKKNRRR